MDESAAGRPILLHGAALAPRQQEEFEALLRHVNELPPLPAVALRLIAMSEDARFSAQDLAETVLVEQALTLKVLRLANSPAFGFPRRVTSIREAIVLLGFREVRYMALGACVVEPSMQGALERARLDHDVFWMNSVVVGHLAQVLALAGDLDQDMAFTAGLLHNIGRLAFAHHRPAQLAECRAEAAASRRSIHDVQRTRYGYADCELRATIARRVATPAAARRVDPEPRPAALDSPGADEPGCDRRPRPTLRTRTRDQRRSRRRRNSTAARPRMAVPRSPTRPSPDRRYRGSHRAGEVVSHHGLSGI